MSGLRQPLMRTRQRSKVLHLLAEHTIPLSSRDIANLTGMSHGAAVGVLALLEGAGWVWAPDQGERQRGVTRYYRLTAEARPLVEDF